MVHSKTSIVNIQLVQNKYFGFFIIIMAALLISRPANAQSENPLPFISPQSPYDSAPEFIGGHAAMMVYFDSAIVYPEPEKTKRMQGSVYFKIDIDSTGQVIQVVCLNGVVGAPNFVKEAQRVLLNMPWWKPAQKNGKAIKATQYIFVPFKL